MKKFLKILLIGVGGLFVLSIGLAVIGMASEEAPANDDTKVTQDAPTTAKESTPVTKDESSEKLNGTDRLVDI
jgi:hypothetical protein